MCYQMSAIYSSILPKVQKLKAEEPIARSPASTYTLSLVALA